MGGDTSPLLPPFSFHTATPRELILGAAATAETAPSSRKEQEAIRLAALRDAKPAESARPAMRSTSPWELLDIDGGGATDRAEEPIVTLSERGRDTLRVFRETRRMKLEGLRKHRDRGAPYDCSDAAGGFAAAVADKNSALTEAERGRDTIRVYRETLRLRDAGVKKLKGRGTPYDCSDASGGFAAAVADKNSALTEAERGRDTIRVYRETLRLRDAGVKKLKGRGTPFATKDEGFVCWRRDATETARMAQVIKARPASTKKPKRRDTTPWTLPETTTKQNYSHQNKTALTNVDTARVFRETKALKAKADRYRNTRGAARCLDWQPKRPATASLPSPSQRTHKKTAAAACLDWSGNWRE